MEIDNKFLHGALDTVRDMIAHPEDMGICEIMIKQGLIKPEDLDACLKEQEEARRRNETLSIGEVLIKCGLLDGAKLSRLIGEYRKRAEGIPDIPRYDIRDRIGEGAASVVYRAWDKKLGRQVALKILRDLPGTSNEIRSRFQQEARAAAGLNHPNLVTVYDAGEAGGKMFIIMEFVEGEPLSEIIKRQDYDTSSMVSVIEQAARAIGTAHKNGLVHRDLKPGNILVTRLGEAKVADFGLACWIESQGNMTKIGSILGSPHYMAPEQVRWRPNGIMPATDVYALGVIIYEILVGRTPFRGKTEMEVYEKILQRDPVEPRRIKPDFDSDNEAICLQALEKDPANRYQDATELAEDLHRYLKKDPIKAKRSRLWPKITKWASKNLMLVSFSLLTIICAVLLLVLLQSKSNQPEHLIPIIRQKADRVQRGVERWQREGRDPSAIASMMSQLDKLMSAGRFKDAEELLDRALAKLGPEPKDQTTMIPESLENKIKMLVEAIKVCRSENQGPSPVDEGLKQIDNLVKVGRVQDAEKLADHALLVIGIWQKQKQVQKAIERAHKEGRDPSQVAPIIQQIDQLMKAEKHAEANGMLDHALQVLTILEKAQRVQEGVKRWQQGGNDPSPVFKIMQEFDPLLKQNKLKEAESVLDRALEVLKTK